MEDNEQRRLTPQEKKRLSYENDRRNTYGENDKASRKAIPLRKKLAIKSIRRADKVALLDAEAASEIVPLSRPKPDWKKGADTPLGEVVSKQLAERDFLIKTADSGPRGRRRSQGVDFNRKPFGGGENSK